jgi:hypothetical protein
MLKCKVILSERQKIPHYKRKTKEMRGNRQMKKLMALLMTAVMLVGMAGCSGEDTATTNNGDTTDGGNDKSATTAIGDNNGEMTDGDETTITTVATEEGTPTQPSGVWEIKYYVDEFNLSTSQGYITNKKDFKGTFSNSATTNSDLNARILVDEGGIDIMLYEYGRNAVKNSSTRNDVDYDITIRTKDDSRHEITAFMGTSGDRIFIDDEYINKVLDILKSGEKIHFRIVQSDRPTTTYLFEVDTSNFAEMYKEMG